MNANPMTTRIERKMKRGGASKRRFFAGFEAIEDRLALSGFGAALEPGIAWPAAPAPEFAPQMVANANPGDVSGPGLILTRAAVLSGDDAADVVSFVWGNPAKPLMFRWDGGGLSSVEMRVRISSADDPSLVLREWRVAGDGRIRDRIESWELAGWSPADGPATLRVEVARERASEFVGGDFQSGTAGNTGAGGGREEGAGVPGAPSPYKMTVWESGETGVGGGTWTASGPGVGDNGSGSGSGSIGGDSGTVATPPVWSGGAIRESEEPRANGWEPVTTRVPAGRVLGVTTAIGDGRAFEDYLGSSGAIGESAAEVEEGGTPADPAWMGAPLATSRDLEAGAAEAVEGWEAVAAALEALGAESAREFALYGAWLDPLMAGWMALTRPMEPIGETPAIQPIAEPIAVAGMGASPAGPIRVGETTKRDETREREAAFPRLPALAVPGLGLAAAVSYWFCQPDSSLAARGWRGRSGSGRRVGSARWRPCGTGSRSSYRSSYRSGGSASRASESRSGSS